MISPPVDQEQYIYSNAAIKRNVKDQKCTFPAVMGFLSHFLLVCVCDFTEVADQASAHQAS